MTQLKPGSNRHNRHVKMLGKLFLWLIPFFISVSVASAEDWFVSQSGAGSKNGTTQQNAWQGLDSTAWGNISPGDTVYVCGRFDDGSLENRNGIDVGKSGTSAKPITIDGDCPGDPGVIYSAYKIKSNAWASQGNGTYKAKYNSQIQRMIEDDFTILRGVKTLDACQKTAGTYYGAEDRTVYYHPSKGNPQTVWYNGGYAVMTAPHDNLVIQNLTMRMSGSAHGGVIVTGNGGTSDNVTIQNNLITHGALSAVLIRTNRIGTLRNVTIKNNEIANCGNGIFYESNSKNYGENIVIESNYIHDIDQYDEFQQKDAHAIWIQHTYNWVIRGNYFKNICNGIAIWKGASSEIKNILIEYNKFESVENIGGAKVGSNDQTFAIRIGGKNAVDMAEKYDNIVIRYNVFQDVHYDAIESKVAYSPSTTPLQVHNNTFIDCLTSLRLYRNIKQPGGAASFKNNIVMNPKAGGRHIEIGWFNDVLPRFFFESDNNLFYPDGADLFNYFAVDSDFAGWKENSGQGAKSLLADPKLGGNLSLTENSPAINAGINLGNGNKAGLASTTSWPYAIVALDQNAYAAWEIGAFVYSGNAPVPGPGPGPTTNKPSAPKNLQIINSE